MEGADGQESIRDFKSSTLVTSARWYRVVSSTLLSVSSETSPDSKEVLTRSRQASASQSSEPAPTSTTSRRDSSRSSNCPKAGSSSRPERSPLAPSSTKLSIERVIVPPHASHRYWGCLPEAVPAQTFPQTGVGPAYGGLFATDLR